MENQQQENSPLILLTGASGYVGGRLLPELEAREVRLRCLARRPEFLRPKVADSTEVVKGDVLEPESLQKALEDVDVAYYLIHSMGAGGSFEEKDREGAQNFARAAAEAGVKRIVYLGGLGQTEEELSPHLRSRHEVGEILRQSGATVVEFRASIVIGSGSLSFEMIRSLVERLPFMIMPKWVSELAQPIAIEDLIEYLVTGLDVDVNESTNFEIGGADQVSYGDIMHLYARVRNMRILAIPVPFLTPYLSSLWLGLVTPLYARIGRKLIESIAHSTVVRDSKALIAFDIVPMGIEPAIRRALENEDLEYAKTRWSDALSSSGDRLKGSTSSFKARLVDSRTVTVSTSPEKAFNPIARIGGETGWYAWTWLWRVRGFVDLLIGGIGTRRGRPSPDSLRVGDTLDFWRVEIYEPNERLRLAAEMKLPGRAWLEFEVSGKNDSSTIRQTASFDPVGIFGRVYWYSLIPLHQLVFGGMLKGIARAATSLEVDEPIDPERSAAIASSLA